ncbi:MAG: HAD family hydrolase [Desulfobacterales bacterium]|nr:MAG: HAD family hydrolase [Desulfobacterales bacterium]
MIYKAVLFDLDGTLLDTLTDIAMTVDRVLEGRHLPTHQLADYRSFISDGIAMLITRSLPEDCRDENTVKECVKEFHSAYEQNWNRMTRPYDGIIETLEKLAAENVKLAVLSNKSHDFTIKCVREFFPNIPFDLVLGQQTGIPPKPDPTGARQISKSMGLLPNQILFVGDSAVDMKTAVAAKMFPVGVLWGFKTYKELKYSGAEILIKHPSEIVPLVI